MKHVTIKMSREDALELGLLFCDCGHAPNNHHDDQKGSCAFCIDCKKYDEVPRRGKIVKARKKNPKPVKLVTPYAIRRLREAYQKRKK